ncbi:MAG: YggT family protein, partial [Woeseiaceae bacterium]
QYLIVVLLLVLFDRMAGPLAIAVAALIELVVLSLNLFFFAVIIRIILSWIAPHTYNPLTAVVSSLADPVLAPFRRIIPPLGGIDISPIFALVLLQAVQIYLQSLKPFPF